MLLRDRLFARLAEMGADPDYRQLAVEVLGITGASQDLARRLVSQALVIEDRRDAWSRAGELVCAQAPITPGVYTLYDADGRVLYVGKAVNLRRRLRSHFSGRRWRALKPEMARVATVEWQEVGSELEALLREAEAIRERQPIVNVQRGLPVLQARRVPRSLLRDVIVVLPSAAADSIELVSARVDGAWMIRRVRRDGSDLAVQATCVKRFFSSLMRYRGAVDAGDSGSALAPIVFSWLAGRGAGATRLDPHDMASARGLRLRLASLLRDDRLFHDRLDQREVVG
jgi:hypothetical protein